jgi:hypothetical protein
MNKSLGGATFVWRNNDQDYHIKETLACLAELCDEVVVAAGGPDGTFEDVFIFIQEMALFSKKWERVTLISITQEMWDSQQGREKLSYFSNMCIERLTTDYVCYIQADEVLHESAFPYVREAIETGAEAFFVRRLNLWKTPMYMLDVPQERKPCSTEVIRLAKKKYRCIDDAESFGVPECYVYGSIDLMTIFHTGFVRDGKKMLVKVKHMLTEVFGWSNDVRAENCETFIPERFFSDTDIVPIPKPLPKFIQQWAKERYPDQPTQSNP